MVTVVVILLLSVIFVFIDLVPLYRERQWKAFWIYTVLLLLSCLLTVLIDLNIEMPSPAKPLKKLISAIWGLK